MWFLRDGVDYGGFWGSCHLRAAWRLQTKTCIIKLSLGTFTSSLCGAACLILWLVISCLDQLLPAIQLRGKMWHLFLPPALHKTWAKTDRCWAAFSFFSGLLKMEKSQELLLGPAHCEKVGYSDHLEPATLQKILLLSIFMLLKHQ